MLGLVNGMTLEPELVLSLDQICVNMGGKTRIRMLFSSKPHFKCGKTSISNACVEAANCCCKGGRRNGVSRWITLKNFPLQFLDSFFSNWVFIDVLVITSFNFDVVIK